MWLVWAVLVIVVYIAPVMFHMAHTHHLLEEYQTAKYHLERILASKGIANRVKALALKQLGELE